MTRHSPSILGSDVDESKTFLFGPAGTGKTSILGGRLVELLISGEPGYSILVLLAEIEHAQRIVDQVKRSNLGPFSELKPVTFNDLARRMVAIFWPLIAREAGFSSPHHPPTFLSYDLAQLLMGRVIDPMIDQGAFSGLVMRRQGIISQILDTLNRAALNRLSVEQAYHRQLNSWGGSAGHRQALSDATKAAHRFRQSCLENNLLDLSLTVQVFEQRLLDHPDFQRYFSERYNHILVDNLEEQTPAGQHFIESLTANSRSALLVFDQFGGYKRFLAADPRGAFQLRKLCDQRVNIGIDSSSEVGLSRLANQVENRLLYTSHPVETASSAVRSVVVARFRRQMIDGVIAELMQLLSEGVEPGEIVILAPYLDSGLCFTLDHQLKENLVPHRFLRRRAVPRSEPRVRAWLTWLVLAHPSWGAQVQAYDLAEALTLSIAALDPVRAQLLARRLFAPDSQVLLDNDNLPPEIAERVGEQPLALVDELRSWLAENGNDRCRIDEFLYRLFHKLLGQPRYQPEPDLASAAVCDWLIRMAKRLRQAAVPLGLETAADIGNSLIDAIYHGLVAATYPDLSDNPGSDSINVATVYSYLLAGKPTRFQIWLDLAATGWWNIPSQPLSNAFVITPAWEPGSIWTMDDDIKVRNRLLSRIVRGLTNRCTEQLILATSELDRRGLPQDGPLWRALETLYNRDTAEVIT